MGNTLAKDNINLCSLFSVSQAGQENSLSWRLEPSGVYTVASLRRHIDEKILPKIAAGVWEWNNLVPRKVNILAWRICYRKLPIRMNFLCKTADKSESHLLIERAVKLEVWEEIKMWWYLFLSSFGSLLDMIQCKKLITNNNLGQIQEAMMLVFIWVVWKF